MDKSVAKKRKNGPRPSDFARVYYDPKEPAGYSNPTRLAKSVPGATKLQAEKWLRGEDTYTLHRPARARLVRDRIIVQGMDDQWEADLVDMQPTAGLNGGNKYLLTVIDVLSKFAWVRPLKNKTGVATAAALEAIFKKGRVPRHLRTDSGKEFENKTVQSLLKKRNVNFFTAKNRTKAAVVERFNRTLKSKMWKYFHATGRKKYIDVLPNLVEAYNNTVHRAIKAAPATVTPYNAHEARKRLYSDLPSYRSAKDARRRKKPKFSVGDIVRISRDKATFEKGYVSSWVSEKFVVARVICGHVNRDRYLLEDLAGEPILGSFKEEELQKVNKEPNRREVRKTVKTSGPDKAVRWRGYPDALVTWVKRAA